MMVGEATAAPTKRLDATHCWPDCHGSRSWSSPMTAPPIPSCAAKGFHLLQTICGCLSGVLKIADHRARQPLGRDLWRNWESIVLRLKALFVRNHDGNRTLCAAGNAGCFQRNDRCHPSSWCARCPTVDMTVATRGRVFKKGSVRFANPLRYKLPPKLEWPQTTQIGQTGQRQVAAYLDQVVVRSLCSDDWFACARPP